MIQTDRNGRSDPGEGLVSHGTGSLCRSALPPSGPERDRILCWRTARTIPETLAPIGSELGTLWARNARPVFDDLSTSQLTPSWFLRSLSGLYRGGPTSAWRDGRILALACSAG
jgi:hypothetical protein